MIVSSLYIRWTRWSAVHYSKQG